VELKSRPAVKAPPMSRTESATIAALTRWMNEDPAANAARGQAGLMAKFLNQVDPLRVLPEAERTRRAEVARRLHMTRLAVASARARRRRGPASDEDGGAVA